MFRANKDKSSSNGNQSLIGTGTRVDGNLHFSGDCYVDGTIQGDVSAGAEKGYLSVSEEGCVKGTVRVPILDLSGRIEGDVYVSEKAVFGPTARVVGNVHYNQLEIAAGAEINGQLIHDEPRLQAVESEKEPESYYESDAVQNAS